MATNYKNHPCFMNTANKYKSIVFKLAHQIMRDDNDTTKSDALKKAWKLAKLLVELYSSKENVNFKFVKASTGELRIANGTRNHFCIPKNLLPKAGNPEYLNLKSIPFFDADKGQWRSFKPHTFIS